MAAVMSQKSKPLSPAVDTGYQQPCATVVTSSGVEALKSAKRKTGEEQIATSEDIMEATASTDTIVTTDTDTFNEASRLLIHKKPRVENEPKILSSLKGGITCADDKIVFESLKKLADFCSISSAGEGAKENTRLVYENEGVGSILSVLKQWRSDVKIQSAGTRSLQNVMFHHPVAKTDVLRLGGAQLIVNNMFKHDQDKELQRSSCGALWNFVSNDAERKQAVLQVGGVTALVAALLTYPSETRLQYWACESLRHLCSSSSDRSDVSSDAISRTLEVGGMGAVVAAYENHRSDHVNIRTSSAKLMKILMGQVERLERLHVPS